MAHVGAVGQVVVAVEPREKRIEIRGLEACSAGRVEDHGLRIERLQLLTDGGKGLLPRTGDIAVTVAIEAHRMGEAAFLFEVVVLPAA